MLNMPAVDKCSFFPELETIVLARCLTLFTVVCTFSGFSIAQETAGIRVGDEIALNLVGEVREEWIRLFSGDNVNESSVLKRLVLGQGMVTEILSDKRVKIEGKAETFVGKPRLITLSFITRVENLWTNPRPRISREDLLGRPPRSAPVKFVELSNLGGVKLRSWSLEERSEVTD